MATSHIACCSSPNNVVLGVEIYKWKPYIQEGIALARFLVPFLSLDSLLVVVCCVVQVHDEPQPSMLGSGLVSKMTHE